MRIRTLALALTLALVAGSCGLDSAPETSLVSLDMRNASPSQATTTLPVSSTTAATSIPTDASSCRPHPVTDAPAATPADAATDDWWGAPEVIVTQHRDGDTVVFDASRSYDPNGFIVLFEWYVNNGNVPIEGVAIKCTLGGDEVLDVTVIATDDEERLGFGGDAVIVGQPVFYPPWCRESANVSLPGPGGAALEEAALSAMPLMALFTDPGSGGEFELQRPIGTATGDYVATESGLRTVLAVNSDFVEAELAGLLDTTTEDDFRPLYADCSVPTAYHLTLVGALNLDPARLAAFASFGSLYPDQCLDNLAIVIERADAYLIDSGMEFSPDQSWGDGEIVEAWTVNMGSLGTAIVDSVSNAEFACDFELDPSDDVNHRFERRSEGEREQLTVWSERVIAGRSPYREVVLRLTITPDSASRSLGDLDPLPWSWAADYIAAIDACLGLPAAYSNFAAADSWTQPGDPFYQPSFFDEKYRCVEGQ